MPSLTLRTLNRELAGWQRRLNIPEWSIRLKWGGKRAMKSNVGLCWWSAEEQEATIMLARDCKELRHTLVHEVLHIVLQGHTTHDGAYSELHERAINRIATALLTTEEK